MTNCAVIFIHILSAVDAMCSVQYVHTVYHQGCRLDYELWDAGTFMGTDGNLIQKFDENGNVNK